MDIRALESKVREIINLLAQNKQETTTYNNYKTYVDSKGTLDLSYEHELSALFEALENKNKLESEVKTKTAELFAALPVSVQRGIQELGKPLLIWEYNNGASRYVLKDVSGVPTFVSEDLV